MELTLTTSGKTTVAELIAEGTVIRDLADALDLIGNAGYQGADGIILNESHLAPEFFDLKTQLAGEILQKFTNYGLRLAIVGDFTNVSSRSLRDFIRESNRLGRIVFVGSTEDALQALAG